MFKILNRCNRSSNLETLETRICLSAATTNDVDGPTTVYDAAIAAFEIKENQGGDYFGETGRIQNIDDVWKTVRFQRDFEDPIVIASPPSFSDVTPATVRVRNITDKGFEIRIQQWEYETGDHLGEELFYLAIERGVYETNDGTRFLANSVSATTNWATESFGAAFISTPVVLGQVISDNDPAAVGLKLDQVDNAGFSFRLQTELGGAEQHGSENVGYVAIDSGAGIGGFETGITPRLVDHLFQEVNFQQSHADPFFFAMPQTNIEAEPGHLRYYKNENFDSLTNSRVSIRYQEEDSRNSVTTVPDPTLRRHAPESIGYAVIDNGFPLQGSSLADGIVRTILPPLPALRYGAVEVSNVSLGAGLTPNSSHFDDHFGAVDWDSATAADAILDGDYLSFNLTIEDGYSANLTSLDLSLFSQEGNREFALYSSATGFSADDLIASVGPTMSSEISLALTTVPDLQGLVGSHEFRIYGFGNTNATNPAGIQQRVGADLILNAQVVASPPPVPALTLANIVVTEGTDQFAVFDVLFNEEFHDSVTVDLNFNSSSAALGNDYGPEQAYSLDGGSTWSLGSQVVLPSGYQRILVRTPLLDDSEYETAETLQLCVSLLGPTVDLSYAPVVATILDNDRSLYVTETGQDTVVSEFGILDSIAVALSDAPASVVKVAVSADTTNEVTVSPSILTFTSANWNVAQEIVVEGIDDLLPDGHSLSNLEFAIIDEDSDPAFSNVPSKTISVTNLENGTAHVVDRHVFYNNSRFDLGDDTANSADDNAIAPSPTNASAAALGKTALLPGHVATFQNYTSYVRGINGIMIDVAGLANPLAIAASDFEFRVGLDDSNSDWSVAPTPSEIKVRLGGGTGGSDRITVVWANDPIKKQWLQVTLKSTDHTGLRADDVHFWGNAIGDTGNSGFNTAANSTDISGIRANPHTIRQPASVDDAYDINRDRSVNTTDITIVRANSTSVRNDLPLISPPLIVTIDAVDKDTETAGDFVTDDQTLYIHGSFTEGSSLSVAIDGKSFTLGIDDELTSDGFGNWTLNYSAVVLAEGDYLVTANSQLGSQSANSNQTVTVAPPIPPPPPTPDIHSDLLALWDFDGDFVDSAVLGAISDDLVEQGETARILGGKGTHAFHSSGGTGNGLFAPDSADINTQSLDEYSVSLWFHSRDGITGTQVLYQQGDADRGLIIYTFDGQVYAGAWNTNVGWSGTWLTADTKNYAWNHVTLSIDATADTMQLYSDGFLADEGFADVIPPQAAAAIGGSMSLMRTWNPATQAVETIIPGSFHGWIDDVRVYQRALNASDANELATAAVVQKVVADLPIEANVPAPVYQLPTGGTTHYVPASATTAELQAILDNLQGNDIVRLDPAGTWESIILRNRTDTSITPGMKYIISDAMDSLPGFGERVNPSHAADGFMPKIITGQLDTGPVLPALNSEIGASDYYIAGIQFVKPIIYGGSSGVAGHHGPVSIAMLNRVPSGGGANSTLPPLSEPILGSTATTYEALGGNIVFDRVIFEGDDLRTRNGLLLSAKDTAVIGSYFHRIIEKRISDSSNTTLHNPTESHGIEIVDSPGRVLIENNYMSVGAIGVMAGNNGALTTDNTPLPIGGQIPGIVPPMEDIVIRGNFITKDLAWASEITQVAGTGAIKNALETKGSNRLLWEDNYIENILNANQKHALVVKVGNGQETDNVTIRNNHVVQATGGAALSNHLDERDNDSPLRVGNITLYDNNIEDIGPMPPDEEDSFAIVQVSSFGDPIEAVVMFDNNLRRRNYFEDREVGFAFSNNELQHITNFSFLSNQMDCAEYGGFVGTGLGANFEDVLGHFTEHYSMEDNVFIACLAGYDIPPDNTIFAAFVEFDPITGDDQINLAESSGIVSITGRLTGDAKVGDIIVLTINGVDSTSPAFLVENSLRFSVDVAASDLLADADSRIDIEFTTTDSAGNSITPTNQRDYVIDTTSPTITINPIANDDIINAVEDDTDLTISGNTNAEDLQQVTVALNGSNYSAIVADGVWAAVVPAADLTSLSTTQQVTADVHDLAGNPALQATRTLTYDPTAPAPPSVQITEDADNDGLINAEEMVGDVNVIISDLTDAVPGDTLTVTAGATPNDFVLTADNILNGIATSFPSPGEGNTIDVTAYVTDLAGNVGDSATDGATVDTTSPTITINPIANDDIINAVEDDTDLTISGNTNAEDLQQVTVALNGSNYSAIVADGVWAAVVPAADLTSLSTTQQVTADVHDLAGNPALQATRTLTYDPTAPAPPSVQITEDADNDGLINAEELVGDVNVIVSDLTGAVPGDTLTVTDGATPNDFVLTADDILNGIATSFPSPGEGNTIDVTAYVTDLAGNVGDSATDSATVEATPPPPSAPASFAIPTSSTKDDSDTTESSNEDNLQAKHPLKNRPISRRRRSR